MTSSSKPSECRVRLYVTTTLDGFIADSDGSVDWLDRYDPKDYGYGDYFGEIGTVIVGRRTYDHICTFGDVWPYASKRTVLLTSKPPAKLPPGALTANNLKDAIAAARKDASSGDIWIVGGAVTMRSALEARLVSQIDVLITPILLGRGLSLLSDLKHQIELDLDGIQTFPDGVVQLRYTIKSS